MSGAFQQRSEVLDAALSRGYNSPRGEVIDVAGRMLSLVLNSEEFEQGQNGARYIVENLANLIINGSIPSQRDTYHSDTYQAGVSTLYGIAVYSLPDTLRAQLPEALSLQT
jgi:hypothetical protein